MRAFQEGRVKDDNDLFREGKLLDPFHGTTPIKIDRLPRMHDAIIAGQRMAFGGQPTNCLVTGFRDLDDGLRHLGPKEVTMLAADSGVGKSTISTQIALHAAASGHGVAYLNLEMSPEMYGLRTVANYIKMPVKQARMGELGIDGHTRLIEGTRSLQEAARRIAMGNQNEHRTIPAIKAFCHKSAEQLGNEGTPLGLIVIDHILQVLVNVKNDKDAEGKARADMLKDLAETFNCHVLALVHITREGSKTGAMPTKNQLASSAWFDRHADNILIFHQKRAQNGTFAGEKGTLSCQKARWGEPFALELEYQRGFFFPWRLDK